MLPDLGSTQEQVAVVVGFFLPLLLSVVIQSKWPEWLRALASVAGYAVAGLAVAWSAGTLTGQTFWQASITALTLGVVGYQGVWKPTNIAPAIRMKTDRQKVQAWEEPVKSLQKMVPRLSGAELDQLVESVSGTDGLTSAAQARKEEINTQQSASAATAPTTATLDSLKMLQESEQQQIDELKQQIATGFEVLRQEIQAHNGLQLQTPAA